jgi:hypothetical protein
MENYGETGEILRYRQVINKLNKELVEWKQVTEKFHDQPFAGNIFVGEALRQQQLQKEVREEEFNEREAENDENQSQNIRKNGERPCKKKNRYKPKSIEVIRKPLKVTKRVFPEKDKKGAPAKNNASGTRTTDDVTGKKTTKKNDEEKRKKSNGGCCILM